MRCKFLVPLIALAGCTPVSNEKGAAPATFDREPYDHCVLMLVDESRSFAELMKPGGEGMRFCNGAIERYFRDRAGSNDHLIVSQLSGNRQTVVWAGAPRELRQDFSGIKEFAENIEHRADAAGSRIWDGISDSLEIVRTDKALWNDRTRLVVIVISDLENTVVDGYTSEQRLDRNLKALAEHGGGIGCYFAGTQETVVWREKLAKCGFKDFVVAHKNEPRPKLPTFE